MKLARTVIYQCAELLKPPKQLTIAEAAEAYMRVSAPGGYNGPYDCSITPYSAEVMNSLNSRRYTEVIYVAPAQSGKSVLVEAWLTHIATCTPSDVLIVNPSEAISRDYSKRRLDRLFENSPTLKKLKSPRISDWNVFDKTLRNGSILSLGSPTISQLSGRSLRAVAMSDYDRFDLSVDGEGSPRDLARKRLTAYGSAGTLYIESSPGFDQNDGTWKPTSPHEAPPCFGILAAYNSGTRERWYFTCPDCNQIFEGDFGLLSYDLNEDMNKVMDSVHMVCPHCGSMIHPKHKKELNSKGQWISEAGIMGLPEQPNRIRSFWLKGTGAAFVTWQTLVQRYVTALKEYDSTGGEEALRAVTETDLSLPYLPKSNCHNRTSEALQDAAEDWDKGTIPADDISVLVASVDVQGNKFVVGVHGYAPRSDGIHTYLIDRYNIQWSERYDDEGRTFPLDPAGYPEDWKQLDSIIDKEYKLASGDIIKPCFLCCDSGGKDGVSTNAYNWYRKAPKSLKARCRLVKGTYSAPNVADKATKVQETTVGSLKFGSKTYSDIVLLLLNSNSLKDMVTNEMVRLHLPTWLSESIFDEYMAEERTPKGWQKIRGKRGMRNEAFDLLYYARAILIYLGIDRWGTSFDRLPASLNMIQKPSLVGIEAPRVTQKQQVRRKQSSHLI